MASYHRLQCLRCVRELPTSSSRFYRTQLRSFSTTPSRSTDGVFRELTEQRVATPWVEAWRRKQQEGHDPTKIKGTPQLPADRKLEPKRMSDSYHKVILPLAQDPWLLDTYMNSSGHIRLGTIFMDLDALSGVVVYKHTGGDVTTVTAACDRMTLRKSLTDICDLEYSGKVTYATGRSSTEVSLQVAKAPPEGQDAKDEDILLQCTFTMVSLDPGTRKPANVNPIQVETAEEKRVYDLGAENSKRRKEMTQKSLKKYTPNDQESDLVHAIWQRELQYHDPNNAVRKPDNVQDMDATVVKTANIMQPQYRNRHQFMIFGGYLLKSSFELAFCCAASFARTRPSFVSLDPSVFQNPVPVGSVLYMTATVVYTDPPLVEATGEQHSQNESEPMTRVQVRVDTKVRNVEHGEAKPTGEFHYTFNVPKDVRVMPRSYSEFMMYLDARRRAQNVAASIASANAGVSPEKTFTPGKDQNVTE